MTNVVLPTDPDVIWAMRRAGTYHPYKCSVRQGGWCDCGGFITDEQERQWCAEQAQINQAMADNGTPWPAPKYDPKAGVHTTGRCREALGCRCDSAPPIPRRKPHIDPSVWRNQMIENLIKEGLDPEEAPEVADKLLALAYETGARLRAEREAREANE